MIEDFTMISSYQRKKEKGGDALCSKCEAAGYIHLHDLDVVLCKSCTITTAHVLNQGLYLQETNIGFEALCWQDDQALEAQKKLADDVKSGRVTMIGDIPILNEITEEIK